MPNSNIVIGFDPGIAITGYGILQDERVLEYGVIRTSAHTPTAERLCSLYDQTQAILQRYAITHAGCEQLFFARNVSTALTVGEARGVLVLAISQAHIPLFELTPLQVKQSISGYGQASKQQMQYMVKSILHLDHLPQPDDAADALAIALATQAYARTH